MRRLFSSVCHSTPRTAAYEQQLETWSITHSLALLPLALGTATYLWCLWDFATFGRGTPAPVDAPKKLVVRGLYRFCRNPMYVGVLTVILGWVVWFWSWQLLIYAIGVWLMFQTFIVLYEEPALRRLFGDEFETYTQRVGRWLPWLPSS